MLPDYLLKRFAAFREATVPLPQHWPSDVKAQTRAQSLVVFSDFMASQPESIAHKISLFLLLLDLLSAIRFFKLFAALTPAQQMQLTGFLFDCPVAILRKGFWGLNTIAKMSIFGQPLTHDILGYKLQAFRPRHEDVK